MARRRARPSRRQRTMVMGTRPQRTWERAIRPVTLWPAQPATMDRRSPSMPTREHTPSARTARRLRWWAHRRDPPVLTAPTPMCSAAGATAAMAPMAARCSSISKALLSAEMPAASLRSRWAATVGMAATSRASAAPQAAAAPAAMAARRQRASTADRWSPPVRAISAFPHSARAAMAAMPATVAAPFSSQATAVARPRQARLSRKRWPAPASRPPAIMALALPRAAWAVAAAAARVDLDCSIRAPAMAAPAGLVETPQSTPMAASTPLATTPTASSRSRSAAVAATAAPLQAL